MALSPSYIYSPFVPQLHSFLHPGYTFAADNSFPPNNGGAEADKYWHSIQTLAFLVALIFLGVVSLILFRWTCRFLGCCGMESTPARKKNTATAIGHFLCIAICISVLVFLGSGKGASKFQEFSKRSTTSIDSMVGTVDNVASVSKGVTQSGQNLELCKKKPDYARCDPDGLLGNGIDQEVAAINALNSKVPVDKVTDAADEFNSLAKVSKRVWVGARTSKRMCERATDAPTHCVCFALT
jgi:hypothetical protein